MFTLTGNGRTLIVDKPIIMGIINTNSDSFYAESRAENVYQALKMAEKHLTEGATILDIGGQSTRPASTLITVEEELKRVLPAIESIAKEFPNCFISIDTFYSAIAKNAVEAGAFMVNDISAGSIDKSMFDTIASLSVPYVLMHMRGTPQTMQGLTDYKNVIEEIIEFLQTKKASCLEKGIRDIIIDPGFGFAKTIEQNLKMIKHFEEFQQLKCPLLMGISRKSFIYKSLNSTPEKSLEATSYLHQVGLSKGATILRVHDVKEANQTIQDVNQEIKKPLYTEGPFKDILN